MHIRPYLQDDHGAVVKLKEASALFDYPIPLKDVRFLAVDQGQILGAICTWSNSFHPGAIYFQVVMAGAFDQSIFRALIVALEATLEEDRRLQISFYVSEGQGIEVLKELGYEKFRTTTEATVLGLEGGGYEGCQPVKSLDQEGFLALAALARAAYEIAHLDNPVRLMDLEAWVTLMKEDLDLEGSFVIRQKGVLEAFALVYDNGDGSCDLGWRSGAHQAQVVGLLQEQWAYCQDKYRAVYVEVDDTDPWAQTLMACLDLKEARQWLSYHKGPDQGCIRAMVYEDLEAVNDVHIRSWHESYKGLMDDQVLESLEDKRQDRLASRQAEFLQGPTSHYGVADLGPLVGFVNYGLARDKTCGRGEIYAIYLLKAYQGQGLGKAMMAYACKALVDMACHDLVVWVLADNPSRGFYEALGGRYLYAKTIRLGQDDLDEVAYYFEDIQQLLLEEEK